jgi:sulfur carrier protein
MEILVNGEKEVVAPAAGIADLLGARDNDAKRVVVELNGSIVPRREFAETRLKEGDVLEIVQFVGGG